MSHCLLMFKKIIITTVIFYYCIVSVYNMFLSKEKSLGGKWFRIKGETLLNNLID